MDAKTKEHWRTILAKNKRWVIAGGVLLLVILLALFLNQPQRSVANFCKVRQQEVARLGSTKQSTYGVAVFPNVGSSSAGDIATSLGRLEAVSPDGVQANIRTLRLAYEKVDNDPSQAFSAGFGALAAENDARIWIKQNCGQ